MYQAENGKWQGLHMRMCLVCVCLNKIAMDVSRVRK